MADLQEAEGDAASGISIERRTLLWIPLALGGGQVLQAAPLLSARAEEEEAFASLTHEQFGARWITLAKSLRLSPAEADESYAAQLAGLVARVPLAALPRLEPGQSRAGIAGGRSWYLAPCAMIEFRMEPGAVLRHHNHPPLVVLTLGLEGEARYRHFEIEGDAPPCTQVDGKEFRVRETRAGVLRPRRTTSLTRARDGIHGFEAGKDGARIVDFIVPLTEDVATFSYVQVSSEPIDAQRRVFGATWTGK